MLNATEDIVLFNARIGSDRREIFLPTLIRAVCLYGEKGSSGEQGKKSPTEKYTIRIPFDAIADDGKTYIEAEKFRLLDDAEAKKHWTIRCVGAILLMKCAANPCLGMSGQSSPKSMAKSLLLIALQIIRGAAAVK